MTSYILDELAVEFSFNWIACPKQEVEGGLEVNNVLQGVYYILAYLEDYKALLSKAKEEGSLSEEEAINHALDNASGGAQCDVRFAAGALFWFTIMMTIG